ncbi:MAG: adenylate/guanylate cyclase domain-containing protein, partial [Acidobacteria bacterium]|nr:adenylate/guanylate cyclase domain-containing protein [Acidobacteriota bacterium]
IGDCVMAFFGAPMSQTDHAVRAVTAALEMLSSLDRENAGRRHRGLPTLECRVAVNSGPVVVGNLGSDQRVDYTVLGNTVNVAARLEESVAGPGQVVVGPRTRELLGESFAIEDLGRFQLKGLQQPIEAYRIARR